MHAKSKGRLREAVDHVVHVVTKLVDVCPELVKPAEKYGKPKEGAR
jgi:hypothetical protein